MVTRKTKAKKLEWREKVLLRLASATGPAIDQIDLVVDPYIWVRDLVIDLVEDEVATPAEIRAALADFVEAGMAAIEGSLFGTQSQARVAIRPRGLVAARVLVPGIGRPTTIRLVIDARSAEGTFDARFDTGNAERDRQLNGSGVVLAIFYLVAMELPSASSPLTVAEMRADLEILCALGIGPRRGPGDRLEVSDDAIRDGLKLIESALGDRLPLRREPLEGDQRAHVHYLAGPFPEVRMTIPKRRKDARSWWRLLALLKKEFYGRRAKRALLR